jgi:hypothetical protein
VVLDAAIDNGARRERGRQLVERLLWKHVDLDAMHEPARGQAEDELPLEVRTLQGRAGRPANERLDGLHDGDEGTRCGRDQAIMLLADLWQIWS